MTVQWTKLKRFGWGNVLFLFCLAVIRCLCIYMNVIHIASTIVVLLLILLLFSNKLNGYLSVFIFLDFTLTHLRSAPHYRMMTPQHFNISKSELESALVDPEVKCVHAFKPPDCNSDCCCTTIAHNVTHVSVRELTLLITNLDLVWPLWSLWLSFYIFFFPSRWK